MKILNLTFLSLLCLTTFVGQGSFLESYCDDTTAHLEYDADGDHVHSSSHHEHEDSDHPGDSEEHSDCKNCHHVCHGNFHPAKIIRSDAGMTISLVTSREKTFFHFLLGGLKSTIHEIYRPPIS